MKERLRNKHILGYKPSDADLGFNITRNDNDRASGNDIYDEATDDDDDDDDENDDDYNDDDDDGNNDDDDGDNDDDDGNFMIILLA